jgi:penicillin-binding protein A
MVLDYKGVAFSFKSRKARRRRQRLKLLLLVLLAVAVFCGYRFLKVSAAVGKIQDLLLGNQVHAAGKQLEALASSVFLRANIRELRALTDLFQDRLPQAEAQFNRLRQEQATTSLRSGQFQKYFVDRGEYLKLKIYTDYKLPRGGDENIWFYALYQAAFFNGGESEKAIARLSPAYKKINVKALALLARVNADLRLGRFEYIFDKNDAPVAYFDVRKQRTYPLIPGLDFSDFDLQVKNGISYFRLTLDAGLQRKIEHLFADFFGTLLLLDLPDNSILAAYSKPRVSRAGNDVFSQAYEPGSIIKIISLLAYLRQANQDLFPYVCPGQIILGGKVFYDWMAHKQVKDYSEALALSCNLSFARMGLEVGSQRLASLLGLFYFNARPFYDWFLKFQTGTFNQELRGDFKLANLAVGLGEISLTTVHAAVLAAIFSQNGLLFPPYIIDDAKSILDLGFYSHSARPLRVLADDLNFGRVKKAMQEVVTNKNGTGHRAWSPAVNLAIKTGTAGNSKQGLDALVIGFFPAEKPRYAFAFRLEGAGKAEFNGAFFLRDLLKILVQQ